MKKFLSFISLFICLCLFCSCGLNSDSKLYTAKGNSALEAGEYEAALEFYDKAAESGNVTAKVEALRNILRIYIDAKEAFDNGDSSKALEIMNKLDYDYSSYSPINKDMDMLSDELKKYETENKRVKRALDELAEAVSDSDFDYAYELINELEGYTLNDEQQEELEYQSNRLERKAESSKNTQNDETARPRAPVNQEETDNNISAQTNTDFYRVRKSWDDPKSQIGAFRTYDNAVKAVNENPGYKAYDSNGKVVFP